MWDTSKAQAVDFVTAGKKLSESKRMCFSPDAAENDDDKLFIRGVPKVGALNTII